MTNTRLFAPTAPRLGWVLALTSTAYFMVVLDSSVVLTALPRMQRDLHTDLASACSWLPSWAGSGASPTRWCRSGSSAAGRSPSVTRPRSL